MGKTHVAVILDKSGSMESVKGETISGFNDYLRKLREDPAAPDMRLTLTLFDTSLLTPVVAELVEKVADLDWTRYQPGGFTALYDAIRQTVKAAEGQVGEDDKALVLIITDGQENSSRDTTRAEVTALIQAAEAKGNWTFAYLSAAPSAFKDAAAIGMAAGNTATYAGTGTGTKAAFRAAGMATSARAASPLRSSASLYADAGLGSVIDDPGRMEPQKQSATDWTRLAGDGQGKASQSAWLKP